MSALLAGALAHAAIGRGAPGAVVWPELGCAHGVFALRVGAFQAAPGGAIDPHAATARSDFRDARPVVRLGTGWSSVYLVVFVYAGNLAPKLELEVRDDIGQTTWSSTAPMSPPHRGVAASTVHPEYVVFELPASSWADAFPRQGRYALLARGAESSRPEVPTEPSCAAEATSWLFVVR